MGNVHKGVWIERARKEVPPGLPPKISGGPRTLANKAVAAATCQICGDEWANTHAGWNDAVFVCGNCSNKLSNWDREKEDRKEGMGNACARSAVRSPQLASMNLPSFGAA